MVYNNFKSSFLCLLLLFLLFPAVYLPAQILFQESHFLHSIEQEKASSGVQNGFIQVPIRMGGPGLNAVTGFHFFLSYDNLKLQFAGISPGAVTNVAAIATNGLLSMQYSNIQAPINCTLPLTLFYINFTRLAVGNVQLNFMHGSQVAGLSSLLPVNFENGVVLQTWQLNLESFPQGAGLLSGEGQYLPGQAASVSAQPNPGYYFINWTRNGQVVSTQPDFDFTIPAENVTLTANFGLNSYMVQLQSNPVAGGSVIGSGAYAFGQTVQVQAVPNTGWAFTGWMLDGQLVSTSPIYTFSMPASNLLLWANFEQLFYPLQLSVNPQEAGTVIGSGSYVYNAQVSVEAIANIGWTFAGWTLNGQTVSTNTNFTFSMPAAAVELVANFNQQFFPLELTANPLDGGTVIGSGSYAYNAQVTAQAFPAEAYNFMSWNQGSTVLSTQPTYNFSMPANALSLVARFSLKTYQIEVTSSNPEHGSVSGGGTYTHGQTVTLSAQAAAGYQFIAWTEQGQTISLQPIFSFTANANRTIVAHFQQIFVCPQPVSLTITDLGLNFASISWVSPNSVELWDIKWGVSGFDPLVEGTLIEGLTQTSYTLIGLNPETTYDVYVRAWCENTYVSTWSGPLQFMTWWVSLAESRLAKPVVFPNPASTHLNVSLPSALAYGQLKLFSSDGRLVMTVNDLKGDIRLDIQHLQTGFYLMHFVLDGYSAYARFSIVRP